MDIEDGCEVELGASDANNCGLCDRGCGIAESCEAGTCTLAAASVPATWRITTLGTEDCVANPLHEGDTGDDNGGIAAGRRFGYYNGDSTVGLFNYQAPAEGARRAQRQVDGIFNDLATGELYSLTEAGEPVDGCADVDGIVRLDEETLEPVGDVTALSEAFDSCNGSPGVFPGMGMVVIHTGINAYEITLATGAVTDLGDGADLDGARGSENWAIWGIAERYNDETYLVFRRSSGTDAIVRRALSDGTDEIILDLDALVDATDGGDASDIATIGANFARGVWVYHGEDVEAILGADPDLNDTEEVFGVCPATFEFPVAG
jgi:hypothetical protein